MFFFLMIANFQKETQREENEDTFIKDEFLDSDYNIKKEIHEKFNR